MSTTIKVSKEIKEKLIRLTQQTKMNQGLIVEYMIDMFLEYNMLKANWVDDLVQERFHQLLISADIEYKKKFEENKHKSILKIQETMIKKKLDLMDKGKAVEFIDQMLGSPESALDLIDRITATQVFRVNAESKMYQPDQDGKPRIMGIPPSQIVRCDEGWHTAMNDCRACHNRLSCEVRKSFIIEWLAVHGTARQQNEFIESGRFELPKLEDK
jgi:hypothetical protein